MKRDFNAYEDFIEMVTSSHVVAAALATFGMKSLADSPDNAVLPENLWMESNEERKEALEKLCLQVYDKFMFVP